MGSRVITNGGLKEYFNSIIYYNVSQRTRIIILTIIVTVALALRLSYIGIPALDRTSWKEIDYIEISKNFTKNNFNILEPTITWPAENPRVTAMEFPIVPYAASLLYKVFGFSPLTVRLITLVAFLILIIYLEKLTAIYLGNIISLLSAFFVSIIPVFHGYGNFLFSEPSLIAFSVISLYYFSRYKMTENTKFLAFAIISFSTALLLKPTALYLSLPVLYIFISFSGLNLKNLAGFALTVLISIIPAVIWYSYAYYLTKNSIDVFGIFEGHDKFQTIGMLSHPYWYKVMKRNLFYLLGGNFGVLLVLTGIITLFITKKGLIFLAYLAAILSFFVIVAEGNIDGMYRHLTIVPPAAVMISAGTITLSFFMFKVAGKVFRKFNLRSNERVTIKYGIIGFVILFVVLNISKFDKSKINVWQPYEWKIAGEIKQHLTDGNKIVTLGNYSIHKGGNDLSPVLYYYSGTTGWSLQKKEWDLQSFDKFRKKGAQMIVCLHINREDGLKDFVRKMEKKFRKVYEDKSGSTIIFLFN